MQKKNEMTELRNLIYRYLKEWKWFAVSVFITLLLAFIYVKLATPIYEVNANILIKEDNGGQAGKGASLMKSFGLGFSGSMDVQDELYVISSYSIMRQVVDSLGLYTDYVEKKFGGIKHIDQYANNVIELVAPAGIQDTLTYSLKFNVAVNKKGEISGKVVQAKVGTIAEFSDLPMPASIQTQLGRFVIRPTKLYKSGKNYNYRIYLNNIDVVTEDYLKEVSVSLANKKANVIALSLKGPNTDKSRDLLNHMISFYNQDALAEKNIEAQNTGEFIRTRLNLIAAELAEAETKVEDFKKSNKIFDVSTESNVYFEQNQAIQKRLIEVETQLSILEKLEEYLSDPKHEFDLLPMASGLYDENSLSAAVDYNKILMERMRLAQTTKSTNPALKVLDGQVSAMKQSVLLSFNNIKQGLLISKENLQNQSNAFTHRFGNAPTLEKQFLDIKRNQAIKEQLVIFLMEKREENALALAAKSPKAKIIDTAYRKYRPVYPRKLITLALALALGFIFPIGYFYFKDLLKNTFDTREELESHTLIPVIGEICMNKDPKESLVISKSSVSSISELFRLIRTNIQFIMNKKTDKVILITSTRSGEGKSFFSLNMASSLSLMNKKILLIGLDIRNPKMTEYLNLKDSYKGVTNYLIDESLTPEDIIIKGVNFDNLDLIVAGPIPPNPGELLLDSRLDDLIVYARENYDYVLLDTAPVGMVSDTFALTRLADKSLYVVRAKYTQKNDISYIETIVAQNRLKDVYLVINGTTTKKGYGYGYGNSKKHK